MCQALGIHECAKQICLPHGAYILVEGNRQKTIKACKLQSMLVHARGKEKTVKDMKWKETTLIDGQGRLLFTRLSLQPRGNKRVKSHELCSAHLVPYQLVNQLVIFFDYILPITACNIKMMTYSGSQIMVPGLAAISLTWELAKNATSALPHQTY